MSVRIGITYGVREKGQLPNPDELANHLSEVLDGLMEIDGIIDPDINATLSEGRVEIVVIINTNDELSAAETAIVAVRTAIHAAGGATKWAPAEGQTHVTAERYELTPA